MFEQLGASLQAIGLTSLFHVPWNLKFLWGPVLDRYETKRRWLLWTEISLSLVIVGLAFVVGGGGDLWVAVSLGFLFLAFLSATHDIAIDAFYLEALDESKQSAYVGWRATFYRIGGIVMGGPILWLIGRAGWFLGILVIAAIMIGLTVYHWFALPDPEREQRPIGLLLRGFLKRRVLAGAGVLATLLLLERQMPFVRPAWSVIHTWVASLPVVGGFGLASWVAIGLPIVVTAAALASLVFRRRNGSPRAEVLADDSGFLGAFTTFIAQPRALTILAFVVLYRVGESFLIKMRWPFLHKELAMTLEQYSILNGTVGTVASVAATLIGGWAIGKIGLRRCIWPFVLGQNILNLLYMVLALSPEPSGLGASVLGATIALEHVGAGLGTAVLMVFLMRCCHPNHKAGHMAILSALMSVGFTVAGVSSGYLVMAAGYGNYFGLTFLATVPSMLLIPWLPYLDGRQPSEANSSADEGLSN